MSERFNQETDINWNREPGVAVIPGSNYAREMEKFEQFPSKYGSNPGNPRQYREFPAMVYRAEFFQGKAVCMAAQPDSINYPNPGDFQRAEEAARRFTERCQLIVKDERERQKAFENGYRSTPDEAVAYLLARREGQATANAEREYQDRNMSEAARAEAAEAVREHFDQTGEIPDTVPEKPRRGRQRKVA